MFFNAFKLTQLFLTDGSLDGNRTNGIILPVGE